MWKVNDGKLLRKLEDNYYEHKGILEDLGKEALKKALTDHFTSELQDHPDDRISIPDLVKSHLSRFNLKRTFGNLCNNGLIQVRTVYTKSDAAKNREDGQELMGASPIIIMMDYAIIIGSNNFGSSNDKIWTQTFEKLIPKEKCVDDLCTFKTLERILGFEFGMHKFTLQVAGLIYITSLRDDVKFWESYKPHMCLLSQEQLLSSSELDTLQSESEKFEQRMTFVVEAVPRFVGYITTLTDSSWIENGVASLAI